MLDGFIHSIWKILLTDNIIAHKFQHFIYVDFFDNVPETFDHILNTFFAHTLYHDKKKMHVPIKQQKKIQFFFNFNKMQIN